MIKVPQAMFQLDPYEKVYRTKLSQRISVRYFHLAKKKKSALKMSAVRRSLSLMLTIFSKKQLLILQILIKCQNSLNNFYKEGYIQSKVGSHIITGVP